METDAITPDRPPSRRWQRRKHARASEILEAAAQIAAETGPDSLHMANIAARAGITKGTIYLYFANKDELLRALAAHNAEQRQAIAAE